MIRKSVLATIVYYDVLGYPLTEFETWKHLIRLEEADHRVSPPTLAEVGRGIDSLLELGKVVRFRGFLTLPGRESLILDRIHEEKRAVKKIARAATLARFIAWTPYVRMIGLTGSLSLKQGDAASDWDFFVVLKSGAIWRGRMILSLLLQLIGKRRHGRYTENRACLNHFVTDTSLEITMKDLFSAHEYRFMYVLTGTRVHRVFELVNRWMSRVKPTFFPTEIPALWSSDTGYFLKALQLFLERCFDFFPMEATLGRWQKRKIDRNPNTRLPGAFIVANEEALIFLPHPKAPTIFDAFKKSLSSVVL